MRQEVISLALCEIFVKPVILKDITNLTLDAKVALRTAKNIKASKLAKFVLKDMLYQKIINVKVALWVVNNAIIQDPA